MCCQLIFHLMYSLSPKVLPLTAYSGLVEERWCHFPYGVNPTQDRSPLPTAFHAPEHGGLGWRVLSSHKYESLHSTIFISRKSSSFSWNLFYLNLFNVLKTNLFVFLGKIQASFDLEVIYLFFLVVHSVCKALQRYISPINFLHYSDLTLAHSQQYYHMILPVLSRDTPLHMNIFSSSSWLPFQMSVFLAAVSIQIEFKYNRRSFIRLVV